MPKIQHESRFRDHFTFQSSDNFSSSFLDHYTTETLSKNDFTIRNITNNYLKPMDWREYELMQLVNKKEANLIELAREDYGMVNAISIPTMNAEAGFSGASIISSEKDAIFQQLKQENMQALVFLTEHFHSSNLQNTNLPEKFISHFFQYLTANEIGILRHLAAGKPFHKIEYSIDVASYEVASNAWLNLRKKKFNKITKERLLYLTAPISIQNLSL